MNENPLGTPPPGKAQSIEQLAPSGPELDEAMIRQTLIAAEAINIDPLSVTLDDMAQGQVNKAQPAPVQVPEKFLKSDGVVDVDKIKASTQALDVAIQQKQEAITKTVDDYMREYQERETKFRNLPNPEKMSPPVVQQPIISQAPAQPSNYEDVVRRDYEQDPLGTTTRLLNLMIEQKFQPIADREKAETTRANLQALAAKDSRILREDVYAKVNEKLQSDPHLWTLKNPHRAAWLEVKEELRLGEPAQAAPAQPSRLSPVLGGGTPPSAPSSQAPSVNGNVDLNTLDLRNKDQEALGDEAMRRLLAGHRA